MKIFSSPRGPISVRGALLMTSFVLFGCSTPTTEPTTEQTVALPGSASVIVPVTALSADGMVNSIGINTKLSYTSSVYSSGFYSIIKPKLVALGVKHLRDEGHTE